MSASGHARLDRLTDSELARVALGGDQAACEALVLRYERPVFNLVARIVQDRDAAEDLAQDTFLKMFRALGQFDARLRFSSWLFRIAHNTAIDHLRRRRPMDVPLEPLPGEEDGGPLATLPDETFDAPDLRVAQLELGDAFDRALARLRPDYRAAIVLRYQEELDYDEIARVLEVPLGTVKTFLHRGRRALAEAMAALGWGPAETGSGGRP